MTTKQKTLKIPAELIRGRLSFPNGSLFALLDITKESGELENLREELKQQEDTLKLNRKKK
jgi:hypothetical protein